MFFCSCSSGKWVREKVGKISDLSVCYCGELSVIVNKVSLEILILLCIV